MLYSIIWICNNNYDVAVYWKEFNTVHAHGLLHGYSSIHMMSDVAYDTEISMSFTLNVNTWLCLLMSTFRLFDITITMSHNTKEHCCKINQDQSINQFPFINEKMSKRTLGQKIDEINVNIASNNKKKYRFSKHDQKH